MAGPEPVGLLVVRAWVDGTSEIGLRAVITQTLDVTSGEETVTNAATVPDVLAGVEAWLEALIGDRLSSERDPSDGSAS